MSLWPRGSTGWYWIKNTKSSRLILLAFLLSVSFHLDMGRQLSFSVWFLVAKNQVFSLHYFGYCYPILELLCRPQLQKGKGMDRWRICLRISNEVLVLVKCQCLRGCCHPYLTGKCRSFSILFLYMISIYASEWWELLSPDFSCLLL